MASGDDWTRRETLLAMHLYCGLKFGQLHGRHPDVIALANVLGRTSGSVARRLSNLASLDPAIVASGRVGSAHASALDHEIWDEFHADWTRTAEASGRLYSRMVPPSAIPTRKEQRQVRARRSVPAIPARPFVGDLETTVPQRRRLAQAFFRRSVLASYEGICCITGNNVPALLSASHIAPWATHPTHAADPCNGLCLEWTIDRAFDRGFITIDEKNRVVVGKCLREYLPNEAVQRRIIAYEGNTITLPQKFHPSATCMEIHRQDVFLG